MGLLNMGQHVDERGRETTDAEVEERGRMSGRVRQDVRGLETATTANSRPESKCCYNSLSIMWESCGGECVTHSPSHSIEINNINQYI